MHQVDDNCLPIPAVQISTEVSVHARTVRIVRSNNENMFSAKDAMIQAQEDWRSFINIPDDYGTYRNDFIRILYAFKSVCNRHLGHIKIATHKVYLDPSATGLLHSVLYRAGPKTIDFEKSKIDNKLSKNEIKSA